MSFVPQRSTPLPKDASRTRRVQEDSDHEKPDILRILDFYTTREERVRDKAYFLWLNGHSQDADENWRAAEAMIEQ